MKDYSFYIDTKHTVWMRAYHKIQATNEEEAKEIAKNIFKLGSGEGEVELETLSDTYESMSYEDNGAPTEELVWPGRVKGYKRDPEVIADNKPMDVTRDEKIDKILETSRWDITQTMD